jgi:predicted permease
MFAMLRRLRARMKYRHFERDLPEEIETHRVLQQAALQRAGHSPDDARTRSYRELGNVRIAREDARAIWIARWIGSAWQDLRYALRGLRRRPGFALTVITILGVSTGLLTAVVIFTDASLLRPWRVPDPDRVGLIQATVMTADGLTSMRVSEYQDVAPTLTSWSGIALAIRGTIGVLNFANGATDQVGVLAITRNYFDTLDMPVRVGRSFDPAETNLLTPAHAIIISHRLWTTALHEDPAAIGAAVRMDGEVYTIVGVAPEGFLDGIDSRNEAWVPLSLDLGDTPQERQPYLDPHHHGLPPGFIVVGRIAPNAVRDQAIAELREQSETYRRASHIDASAFTLVDTRPISHGAVQGSEKDALGLAILALLLVQLLACANVGNLLLAGAMARRQEIAVRFAIGAGRARVIRQLLTEAAVLVAIATSVGLSIAIVLPRLLASRVQIWGSQRPEFFAPGIATFEVLGGIVVLSTLIVGVLPAFRSSTVGLSLSANDRHGQNRSGLVLRRLLLGAQIALATVLLCGAGLLTRGVARALALDPGFPIAEFQNVEITLPFVSDGTRRVQVFSTTNDAGRRRQAFFQALFNEVQAPGWPPSAYAESLPIAPRDSYAFFVKFTDASGIHQVALLRRNVSTNYFQTLGIALERGRMPAADSEGREVVLNKSAAKLLFPETDPIGSAFLHEVGPGNWEPVTVVGLVRDLPVTSLVDTAPTAYAATSMIVEHLLVRSTDPTIGKRVAAIATRIDPGVKVTAHPLIDSVSDTLDNARMGGMAAWAVSAIGLALATIGAFGVFAYAVEERRREVGIRMALGARPSQVVGFVVRSSQWTMVAGLAAGLGMTLVLSPLLRAHLYGLSAFDPITYLEVCGILAASAMLATWIPARRATRINPVEALRAE